MPSPDGRRRDSVILFKTRISEYLNIRISTHYTTLNKPAELWTGLKGPGTCISLQNILVTPPPALLRHGFLSVPSIPKNALCFIYIDVFILCNVYVFLFALIFIFWFVFIFIYLHVCRYLSLSQRYMVMFLKFIWHLKMIIGYKLIATILFVAINILSVIP